LSPDSIIGFFDEASPQTTANTVRRWSFGRPEVWKNTTKFKANTFGFYALNGVSVVDFLPHSKKEDICCFLRSIRNANPVGRIILILDNFRSHKARATMVQAEHLDIELIFLPPYSPDLNPIEYIWKSIKRVISDRFVKNLEDMRMIIARSFLDFSAKLSFARSWMDKFMGVISIDS
jgi:transposase